MQFSSKIMVVGFAAVVQGAALTSRSLSGQATFYGGNTAGGACSFSTYTIPAGIYGTALSDSNWDTSANCGACVSVTGPAGNTITAMIVDECPGCGTNHLDLFPDAFAKLSDPTVGIIETTWEYVDCPISSPLKVHNKEGVSPYWFSMQAVNANKAVSTLEVSTNGGSTWQSTTRKDYNFFENPSGFGTASVDVKITSVDGDVVTVKDVDVVAGLSVTADSNFGGSAAPVVVSSKAAVVVPKPTSTSVAPVVVAPKPTSTPAAPVVVAPEATTSSVAPVVQKPSTTAEAVETSSEAPVAAPVTTVVPPSSTTTPLPTLPVAPKPTDTTSSSTITLTSTIHVPESSSVSKSKCSSVFPTTTLISSASPVSVVAGVSTSANSTYTYTPSAPSNATSVWAPTASASGGIFMVPSPTETPAPFTNSASHTAAGLGSLLLVAVAAIVLV